MRQRFLTEALQIEYQLQRYSADQLLGINIPNQRECFIEQLIDSKRRIEYFRALQAIHIDSHSVDPTSTTFDPLKAAVWHSRQGNVDESTWLLFLATHFGKNLTTNWRLLQAFYGGLGQGVIWSWQNITANQREFLRWFRKNHPAIKQHGSFGNHRKYETLNISSKASTHLAIDSYIRWIGAPYSHTQRFNKFIAEAGSNPRLTFAKLYKALEIHRFGRMAKFDFLCMLGKVGVIPIEPDSTYLVGATGPVPGAKLLFAGTTESSMNRKELEIKLTTLENYLAWPFGMQILEDALCNWQKSPTIFKHFAG